MNRGVAVKIKYFDENGGWLERKTTASSSATFTAKNLTIVNVDFNGLDNSESDHFHELVGVNSPAVVILQNVSPAALNRMKGNSIVRKSYAVMETSRSEQKEDSTVALLRLGLQCEPTEVPKTDGKQAFRALVQVNIRIPSGPSLSITVLHMEPGASRRLTFAMALLKAHPNVDIAVLLSNVTEGMVPTEDPFRELQASRAAAGFVDVMEEGMERSSGWSTPWTMWLKSVKYTVLSSAAEIFAGQEPRYLSTTLTQRGQANSTITIPMPRSAKTGTSKSPSAASAPPSQPLPDPAILSVEAAKAPPVQTNTSATEIIQRLLRQQSAQPKWKASNSFVLKASDAKLSTAESIFDLTNFFPSPAEALEALNAKSFNWPADFCVVHNAVLCADSVTHADRQAFRRYVRDNKTNTTLTSQIFAATSALGSAVAAVPATAAEKPWAKQGSRGEMEEFISYQRHLKDSIRREWSESCCMIVYQITPREMKFNVTPAVGLAKDNLKKAIHYLNYSKTASKESNPLADYPYDYALLFSVERQGYWLIAATHVPCDIVACRMVI